MEPITLTASQFQFITDRLSQFYINNENTLDFLYESQYKVPLQQYLCVCYGIQSSYEAGVKARKIEFYRFIGTVNQQNGYYIQSYTLPTNTETDFVTLVPTEIFRIQDCNHLRQSIFQFEDKTSLFRSTLFFVPSQHKMFRIHCVLQFLTLPVYSLQSSSVVISPEKFLISESKKKQILKRLHSQMTLWENSIRAHGTVECAIP
jgi:hypothetical protein